MKQCWSKINDYRTFKNFTYIIQGYNLIQKVDSNRSICSQEKSEYCLNKKTAKITKTEHPSKVYAITYNDEILNSFKRELQLKDNESTIWSKIIELSSQLKVFKLVATLILVFKKIESAVKIKYNHFCSSWEAEILINENDIHGVS